MEAMARRFRPEVLVLGLTLIAVGVVWMLANAGRVDLLATLRAWWPLTLVVWGALELVAFALNRDARRS
jgi:cell wall-active antibiotic response 4TMS protein YvqF